MKKTSTIFVIGILLLTSFLTLLPQRTYAACDSLTEEQIKAKSQDQLKAYIAECEAESKRLEGLLGQQKGQSNSLKQDIAVLNNRIGKASTDIKAKTVTIKKLSTEITTRENRIETLEEKIGSSLASIGQLIRQTDELSNSNFVHFLFSKKNISDLYNNVNAYETLNRDLSVKIDEIRGVKVQTEKEKQTLEGEKNEELDAKALLEKAKREVERSQAERQSLLSISKKAESVYEKDIAEKRKQAEKIRSRLVTYAGGGKAIPFGDAVVLAESASTLTGIRPAFLLAILTQETNLGANVGQCYLKDQYTGAGVKASGAAIANVMKPSRDVIPFLAITKELGMDPFKTKVSCPLGGSGYGGAMGASQFIPSTWNSLKTRLASILGVTPNPWIYRDAFTASALYLTDLGAGSKTYTGERNAACRYYSGRSCDSRAPANTFYGNSVMNISNKVQDDIDYLKQYGVSRR